MVSNPNIADVIPFKGIEFELEVKLYFVVMKKKGLISFPNFELIIPS